MNTLEEKSVELFNQHYSCSEAIVRAAYEAKIIDQNLDIEQLTQIASSFSGGIGGTKCLCGAVAGAQIVLGLIFGRKDLNTQPANIKKVAGEYMEKFKAKRKVTCCKALTEGYDFLSPERRQNCVLIVADAAKILEEHIRENLSKSS